MAKRDSTSQLNHEYRRATVNSQRGNIHEQRVVAAVTSDVHNVFTQDDILSLLNNESWYQSSVYIDYLLNKKKVEKRNSEILERILHENGGEELEELDEIQTLPKVSLSPKALAILDACNEKELLCLRGQLVHSEGGGEEDDFFDDSSEQ